MIFKANFTGAIDMLTDNASVKAGDSFLKPACAVECPDTFYRMPLFGIIDTALIKHNFYLVIEKGFVFGFRVHFQHRFIIKNCDDMPRDFSQGLTGNTEKSSKIQ